MTKVMMMLGAYPFMLDTAAYQKLKRRSSWRWKKQDRIGRKPARHYMGPGSDEITLHGQILPHWKGGLFQVDLMRAMADQGEPLLILECQGGYVLGDWTILSIDEDEEELLGDGAPRVIDFTMKLGEYGGDEQGIDSLALGIAAVSTLARLL